MKKIYYAIQVSDNTFMPKEEFNDLGDVSIDKAMQFESRNAALLWLSETYGPQSLLEVVKVTEYIHEKINASKYVRQK